MDSQIRRVFLVVGPECSGNHIVKRLFLQANVWGDYDYVQRLDDFLFKKKKLSEIIGDWQGDILHGDSMPARDYEFTDWVECTRRYEQEGYAVHWVIPVRNYLCTAGSKLNRGMTRERDLVHQLQEEYRTIFSQLVMHGGHFYLLPLTTLFEHPRYIFAEIKSIYGLDVPLKLEDKLYDADKKHRLEVEGSQETG